LRGAEDAYKEGLEFCRNEPDDEKNNLAIQACVLRSSFVHFLCNAKRIEEAQSLLVESERYAREHSDIEEGELLQAALGAGIHFSIASGDEDGAVERITELEQAASTAGKADRIGGDLMNIANRAVHRNAYRAALASAEACVRLAHRCVELAPSFLVGALYTEAMVIMKSGDDDTALKKAEAILDLCHSPDDTIIKQATQHLIAEIKRCSGDSQTAVDLAQQALSVAKGTPEDVAFTKLALARALNDNGQTEEALKQANQAWVLLRPTTIPAEGVVDVLGQITNYASQLGAQDVVADAITALSATPDKSEDIKADKALVLARVDANQQLRERLLQFLQESDRPTNVDNKKYGTLAAANAAVVQPLISWWDDVLDTGPESIAGAYEFWGRGNFARILRNTRDYPNSFNITLEVRTLDDVKRAIRLWGLYADFLILLWKGPTESARARMVVPLDFEAPGGWGYMVFLGTVLKKKGSKRRWSMGLGYGSTLPADVTAFLATEAKGFMESGRLVVVPAVGAGCINPGHGPFEQLLAESANAVPSIRWKGIAGTPIGHIPYSPDAPFELLVEMADAESERLRKLRLLLLQRSRQMNPGGNVGLAAKTLSLEIDDALRDLEARNSSTVRKRGLAKSKEPLTGMTARFRSSGTRLGCGRSESPFAPLLVLQNLGYGWRVEGAEVPRFPARFEPQGDDVIGAWLAPPKSGWVVPMLKEETEKQAPLTVDPQTENRTEESIPD
jgi:tetratricopeptide (TPR) repeat protein